jgi:hypothetical protein
MRTDKIWYNISHYFGRGESGMLCCTSKLTHRIIKMHLEACFFIVSWNFPVTQLWEQVGAQGASGPSMNQTRVRGCLCGGQCVSV